MSSPTSSMDIILGAVVLAGILGGLFLGAACIQTYNYYHKYRSDDIMVKGAAAVLAANALQFAVYTYTIWYYVVDAFDTAWLSTWLSVALVLLLDIFYTIYLIKLAPTLVIPGLVGVTVAAGNIVAVVLGVRIIIFTHFTNIYAISSSALIYLFFGLFCVKSTSIAAAMTYYLYGSNAGFTRDSNTSVKRAIKLVVGSSLLVAFVHLLIYNPDFLTHSGSVCSFCVLACHLAMPIA
ncbi:hypothetical protein B0H13DRAFT_2363961 [Mycena leptocephala]|nr:hypothetical protein B0H13DRAFT_2363961 [Mycena leptocephala]